MKVSPKYLVAIAVPVLLATGFYTVRASDHDDGENANKERNLNLTDVYAFREDWQNASPVTGDDGNLVIVMNSNPRSLPRTQYSFSSTARYEMHLSRGGANTTANQNARPGGSDDITLRFQFAAIDSSGQQAITFTMIRGTDVQTFTTGAGSATIKSTNVGTATTPPTDVVNTVTVGGAPVKIFAGLRQDPFFFRVDGFFKWRAQAATSASAGVSNLALLQSGDDFTENYNVNSIVVSVPISLLQANSDKIFDIWSTISVLK